MPLVTNTDLTPKSPKDSQIESRYLVLPNHTNHYGTAFGGVIVSWIDSVAVMVAQRHCGRVSVTVSIDKISFLAPINVGDHVILKASVNYVGKTSMEVGVQVSKENPYTGEVVRATTAYLTFVALDESKKPVPINPIKPETSDEKRRFNNAAIRVEVRREMGKKLHLRPNV